MILGSNSTYFAEIHGAALDAAISQLTVLDEGQGGDVSLISTGDYIRITRISRKKELAQIEIPMSGYLPFPIQIPWKRFFLLLKGHSEVIRIVLELNNRGSGKFKIDNMVFDYESLTEQYSLPFGMDFKPQIEIDRQRLIDRVSQIDALNLETGVAQIDVIAKRYERDSELTKIIKRLRGNKCQICGYSFKTKSGEDYSECHHLERLADNGLDVSKNILVLCANHHRQFHFGDVRVFHHDEHGIKLFIDGVENNCSF